MFKEVISGISALTMEVGRSANVIRAGALFFVLALTSGCATVFAPTDAPPVDIAAIHPGMARVEVERQLGRATLDVRPEIGSGAARKCEYRYFERVPVDADASTVDTLKNKMIGFRDRGVTIFFDKNDRVLSLYIEKASLNAQFEGANRAGPD